MSNIFRNFTAEFINNTIETIGLHSFRRYLNELVMRRKFITKKFIRDVLNDRYALVIGNEIILNTKIESTGNSSGRADHLWSSFSLVKEMAGYSHTLTCCLSKPRNRQEAGWSLGGACQKNASTEDAMFINEEYMETSQRCDSDLTEIYALISSPWIV